MVTCPHCAINKPEWSTDAKVWMHRLPRLDKRCQNPPSGAGAIAEPAGDCSIGEPETMEAHAERVSRIDRMRRERDEALAHCRELAKALKDAADLIDHLSRRDGCHAKTKMYRDLLATHPEWLK